MYLTQVQTTSPPKPKPIRSQEEEDLPPGYLQSLMNRIIHNVNIVVNNLILKFVDDDIVLSVNVKSAECYSVNKEWARAFIELSMPELVLRRVVDFHDLTICLDKRNASGRYRKTFCYVMTGGTLCLRGGRPSVCPSVTLYRYMYHFAFSTQQMLDRPYHICIVMPT